GGWRSTSLVRRLSEGLRMLLTRISMKEMELVPAGEERLLFPGNRMTIPDQSGLALNVVQASASRYLEDLGVVDAGSILPAVLDSLVDTHSKFQERPYDPYLGDRLQVVFNPRARMARTVLCFPFGKGMNHLSENGVYSLAGPADHNSHSTALLARTRSFSYLLNVVPDSTYIPPASRPPVSVVQIGVLSSADTEGRRHVDVALDPESWSRALIVDEGGAVWLWWEEKERQYSGKLGKYTNLLEGHDRVFTCLEKTALERKATYTCLCTTHEIVWIDETKVGPPVLSWKHDYGGGRLRDLYVTVVRNDEGENYLLSSPSDPLVMVCRVPSFPPLRFQIKPYSLHIPSALEHHGLSAMDAVQLSKISRDKKPATLLLSLASDGSVASLPLRHLSDEDVASELRLVGNDAVQALADGVGPLDEDPSADISGEVGLVRLDQGEERSRAKYGRYEGRWAWEAINRLPRPDRADMFSAELFVKHLREMEAPLPHLTLAADLARDVCPDEDSDIRSHLMRPLYMDAQHVDTDLEEFERIQYGNHLEVIMDTSKAVELDFPDARKIDKALLARDLRLSSVVLASDPISPPIVDKNLTPLPGTPDDVFARAAGQLSLKDKEPPALALHFLLPQETESETAGKPLENASLRQLMYDWTIGTDPREWQWKSWREETEETPSYPSQRSLKALPLPQRPVKPLPSPKLAQSVSFSQSSLPLSAKKNEESSFPPPQRGAEPSQIGIPRHQQSSPVPQFAHSQFLSQGEFQHASTQVVPGPFGGKLDSGKTGKKRNTKKRVGGF
ncbi:hypothetical protein P7C73_g6240, partial [Tremellales sp. Uapishka_1]